MGLVSVAPPKGGGWSVEQSSTRITLGKLGMLPSQSFAGLVVLAQLPALKKKWNSLIGMCGSGLVMQATRDTETS